MLIVKGRIKKLSNFSIKPISLLLQYCYVLYIADKLTMVNN